MRDTRATNSVSRKYLYAGIIVMLIMASIAGYVFWDLWRTNSVSDEASGDADAALEQAWDNGNDDADIDLSNIDAPSDAGANTVGGEALYGGPTKTFARIDIPRYGPGWSYTVLQGVGQKQLAAGPGWYPETAQPGAVGNMALAGHRMGYGAPFTKLGSLHVCDKIVVSTRTHKYTYAVLTMDNDPAKRRADMSSCVADPGTVDALSDGKYKHLVGRHITTPNDVAVLNSLPGAQGKTEPTLAMLTLTTCHPWYTNTHRQIVHAVLVDSAVWAR